MEQFNLYDIVCLKEDISTPPLRKGTAGTIIYVYKPNKLFEIDFVSKEGGTFASVVLESKQLLKIDEDKFHTIKEVIIFRVKL